jgi:hypothetical protein
MRTPPVGTPDADSPMLATSTESSASLEQPDSADRKTATTTVATEVARTEDILPG